MNKSTLNVWHTGVAAGALIACLLPTVSQARDRGVNQPGAAGNTGAKAAAKDADWAEQDASDAIDLAVYAVYDAQLAVLNALDARVYADEQAKIAGM